MRTPFFVQIKLNLCLNIKNLNALVETAGFANAVCAVVLTALGALNDVGGVFKSPNAGASLHLSRVRSFSLWYCHVSFLLG